MKAKITENFTCYPPDRPSTKVTFEPGDIVGGEVARWALSAGKAKEVKATRKKSMSKAPENK